MTRRPATWTCGPPGTSSASSRAIVGVDRVPLRYYRAKLEAEKLVRGCGLGYTILRATQFHDLVWRLLSALARLPVMLVPGISFQPIDTRDVAGRLVELAAGDPAGRVPDMGGLEIRATSDLAGVHLRETGKRRRVMSVRLPGRTFRGFGQGHHLAPEHAAGRITFDEFARERRTST